MPRVDRPSGGHLGRDDRASARVCFGASRSLFLRAIGAAFPLVLAMACGPSNEASPFSSITDAGGDAGASGSGGTGGSIDGGILGRPCLVDSDCTDEIDCTVDRCNPDTLRCKPAPDDSKCQDGLYCNGVEICDPIVGCVVGDAVDCSDDNSCTIDRCDETSTLCQHVERDADGDGDPDIHCGGGDCNETNPLVNSKVDEVCANNVDDNCDGMVDEAPCVSVANDTCSTALELPGPGSYAMSTVGAVLDQSASCLTFASGAGRDVVAAITIPPGPSQRVDARVRAPSGTVAVALFGMCGDASTEIACSPNYLAQLSGSLAAARAWSVPPGSYPIFVYSEPAQSVILDVTLSPAETAPSNETCGTATPITAGDAVKVPLFGATVDLATTCIAATGELVYVLTLDDTYDVRAFANASDGNALVSLSVRDANCATPEAEIGCVTSSPVSLLTRSVGPGQVYFAVRASYPIDASLLLTLEPPTQKPADDLCSTAPELTPNVRTPLTLDDHSDDISLCSSSLPDAFGTLVLDAPSDVLAILRTSSTGVRSVSIVEGTCDALSNVACTPVGSSPIRAAAYNLEAGTYHVVAETDSGGGSELSVLVRNPEAPQLVAFADDCASAFVIPPTGGRFQGNTANANAQYSAGCDQGGNTTFGAPEQMLTFTLDAKKRVVLDSRSSAYSVLLDVRQGPTCPGTEVTNGCTISSGTQRAYLDLTLEAGTYQVQVDGFNGQSGAWFLDVWVTDP